MNILQLVGLVSMLAWLGGASPADWKPEERIHRSWNYVKQPPREYPESRAASPSIALEFQVRKGEYVCGNKICKLEPGVVPPGCENHPCQYPILP